MRLVIRTIGIVRATVTLANLACNMDRLVFHARRAVMGQLPPNDRKSAA